MSPSLLQRSSTLLPDPMLEEHGEILARALERYAKRLLPEDLRALIDAPTASTVENLREATGADSIALWLVDGGRESLVATYSDPVDGRFIGGELPLSEGLISLVFASEQPVCENRVAEDERHSKKIDKAVGKETGAMIAVPLYLGGALCGVVSAVQWRSEDGGGGGLGSGFTSGQLTVAQRGSAVIERLVNFQLAKAAMGFEV